MFLTFRKLIDISQITTPARNISLYRGFPDKAIDEVENGQNPLRRIEVVAAAAAAGEWTSFHLDQYLTSTGLLGLARLLTYLLLTTNKGTSTGTIIDAAVHVKIFMMKYTLSWHRNASVPFHWFDSIPCWMHGLSMFVRCARYSSGTVCGRSDLLGLSPIDRYCRGRLGLDGFPFKSVLKVYLHIPLRWRRCDFSPTRKRLCACQNDRGRRFPYVAAALG